MKRHSGEPRSRRWHSAARSRLALIVVWARRSSGVDRIGFTSFLLRWLHVFAGMVWLGMIWFVNFIQLVAVAEAEPGRAAGDPEAHRAARGADLPPCLAPDDRQRRAAAGHRGYLLRPAGLRVAGLHSAAAQHAAVGRHARRHGDVHVRAHDDLAGAADRARPGAGRYREDRRGARSRLRPMRAGTWCWRCR